MNIGLILSGGIGQRINSKIPKQYLKHNGRMMITYVLETVYKHEEIDVVCIVADESWHNIIQKEQKDFSYFSTKFKGFSKPGQNRQMSILNGLRDIIKYSSPDDIVMVHDAVRPFVTAEQISKCFSAMEGHDGVVPVLPIADTVYYSQDGKTVSGLIKRSQIFAGQAPEFFRVEKYLKANEELLPDKILQVTGSTEVAIMGGLDVIMIPGDENNFKITTQNDLNKFYERIN